MQVCEPVANAMGGLRPLAIVFLRCGSVGIRRITPLRMRSSRFRRFLSREGVCGGCAYRKSNPAILMVQSAQDRAADDIPGPLNAAMDGGILVQ
jgi:hypothetical protein